MNEKSEAANRAATRIRNTPFTLADTMVALFASDEEKDDAERMIVNKLAEIIEKETLCGVLLRVAEAAKQYAGPTTDCCMGGEATSELCELHQALAQWEHLKKANEVPF